MRISKQLLAISAILLVGSRPVLAQGVFTSSSQLSSSVYTQQRDSDTVRSFPITYLDEMSIAAKPTTVLGKATLSPTVPDPAKDSLQFLRYVDSMATLRVAAMRTNESGLKKESGKREQSLNRLRDVPSILPFFISSSTASKATGMIKTRMSSGFGIRQHPILGSLVSHTGIDLPAPLGTMVYATADGYCRQIINQPDGIGLAIYLTHGRGHQTLYGHLLATSIKPGEFVLRGQVIGRVGTSGLTTGPHLHYGVRYHGQVVDPLPYCFLLSKPKKPIATLTRK